MNLLGRSRKPAAFWYLGRRSLVVAVVRRYLDEPLMLACAMTTGSLRAGSPKTGTSLFAPGLLEASVAVESRGLEHTAALSNEYCSLGTEHSGEEKPDREEHRVVVDGIADTWAFASMPAIVGVRRAFDDAGLKLVGLDCEACATATVSNYLGYDGADPVDPLAAVELHEDCVDAATDLGSSLIVPVGLALTRLGAVRSYARG